jgi:hypothetical protein
MFDKIFGNYLSKKGRITEEQLQNIIEDQKNVRLKLGMIAVAEKLMTPEQTDEVNHLQVITDKRFGDIAVEKGYITEEQVHRLLKKQGNISLLFIQCVIDSGYMNLEEIDEELSNYQSEMGFTHSDMDDLISGDIDRMVDVFLPEQDNLNRRLCGVAVRTFLRVIDSSCYIEKAYIVNKLDVEHLAIQESKGDHSIFTGLSGQDKNLLPVASLFAKEDFPEVDLDALDAVGEFINCVDGLFASELSDENIDIDMLPPNYYEQKVQIEGNQICVLPIVIQNKKVELLVVIDSAVSIK